MTHDAIIECVPNFSEGLDEAKVLRVVAAMQVEGVSLLDFSQDADHNRSVVTIAGSPGSVMEAAVRAAGASTLPARPVRIHASVPRTSSPLFR